MGKNMGKKTRKASHWMLDLEKFGQWSGQSHGCFEVGKAGRREQRRLPVESLGDPGEEKPTTWRGGYKIPKIGYPNQCKLFFFLNY